MRIEPTGRFSRGMHDNRGSCKDIVAESIRQVGVNPFVQVRIVGLLGATDAAYAEAAGASVHG